jgi:hypothetical protein
MACDAFAVFASGASSTRWQAAPRMPTKARYEIVLLKFGRRLRKAA